MDTAPPPPEDTLPEIASNKTQARMRRHNAQVADLNAVRDDLYVGGWDGCELLLPRSLSQC